MSQPRPPPYATVESVHVTHPAPVYNYNQHPPANTGAYQPPPGPPMYAQQGVAVQTVYPAGVVVTNAAPVITTTRTVAVVPTQVVIVGGGTCPVCRVGVLNDEYSCLGIFFAIFFFPLGIILCLLMRERHCSNCNAMFK